MTSSPVLIMSYFTKQFLVQSDASDFAIGAVLSQNTENGEHPIVYISRKLLPRERNYSVIEQECLAIVWTVESLTYYLKGTSFVVQTDHNPLVWLNRMKDKNQRLLRWALALQPDQISVLHRNGQHKENVDGLSRC